MGCAYASLPPQPIARMEPVCHVKHEVPFVLYQNKQVPPAAKELLFKWLHAHLKFVYTRHTITDEHKSIARPHNCYVFFRHDTHCCCRMPVLDVNQRSSTSIICFCMVSETLLNTNYNCHSLQVNGPIFHTKSCTSSTVPLYDWASNKLE